MNPVNAQLLRSAIALLAACAAISASHAQQACARADFNGDNRSDVLWHNQGPDGTGQSYLHLMDGTAITAEGSPRTVPDPNWQIAGVGDFDGDGKADVLWRNAATGHNYVHFMNGLAVAAEGYLRGVSSPWQVAGVGDFNGDGKADILWRHAVDGSNYIHMMDGLAIVAEGHTRTLDVALWQIAGVGDLDGDGKADILWRETVEGKTYLHPMDGFAIKPTEGYTKWVPDFNWTIAGLGDFNGDRKADILWRNTVTGENYIHFMDGKTTIQEGFTRTVGLAWKVRAINDYNGDGRADILWRQDGSGTNYINFMNGLTVASEGFARAVSDVAWQQVPAPSHTAFSTSCGITPAMVPSRTSGVAPLYVFFNATGTTATGVARPFHELEYRWDFGDPAGSPVSGTTWGNGARPGASSRNSATGPVAAHVFERPGTYTVKLSVTSGGNTVTTTAQITVQDPDSVASLSGANVIYVSTDGVFPANEVPAAATKVTTSNFATAMNSLSASKKRILFRRGQTWTHGSTESLSVAGPGIIGAWGSGAKPVVQRTGTETQMTFSAQDWRLMDIDFRGSGSTNQNHAGHAFYGGGNRILHLRCDLSGFAEQYLPNPFHLSSGEILFADNAFVDGSMTGSTIRNMYAAGRRFSLMGTNFDPSANSHTVRIHQMWDGVIQHNSFAGGLADGHLLKVHAPCWNGPGCDVIQALGTDTFSENVVISDNLYSNDVSPWMVSIAPQNDQSNEPVRNFISERNVYRTKNGNGLIALRIDAREFTSRNELIDMSNGGSDVIGISITTNGIVPAPTNVSIFNNTVYRANSASSFATVSIGGGATNTTVKNNLARAPSVSNPTAISGSGTGLVASNNSTGGSSGQIRTANPFVVGSPVAVTDFRPAAASYARNGGTAAPVFSDLLREARPKESAIDMGAFEFVP